MCIPLSIGPIVEKKAERSKLARGRGVYFNLVGAMRSPGVDKRPRWERCSPPECDDISLGSIVPPCSWCGRRQCALGKSNTVKPSGRLVSIQAASFGARFWYAFTASAKYRSAVAWSGAWKMVRSVARRQIPARCFATGQPGSWKLRAALAKPPYRAVGRVPKGDLAGEARTFSCRASAISETPARNQRNTGF